MRRRLSMVPLRWRNKHGEAPFRADVVGIASWVSGFYGGGWLYGVVAALATSQTSVHPPILLPGALIQAYTCNPQLNSQRAVVRATDEGVPAGAVRL